MNRVVRRVAERFASRLLKLGPGRPEQRATATLKAMKKFPARSKGDLQSAMLSAAHYAQKQNKTMFVYPGTSFMHLIWRVAYKPADYLDPINNTGSYLYSVSPTLDVERHELERPT